ncbi:MAG TPA: hypothetical protein VF469_13890 [Kofleriaceae bacterium]
MRRSQIDLEASCLAALSLVGAALALGGCSGDRPAQNTDLQAEPTTQAVTQTDDGTSEPFDKLPVLDDSSSPQVLAELLAKPTALGETTALHIRMPPPQDPKLVDSLVRVVGRSDDLHVLFRSDALAQLGVIPKSPGPDFFTSFGSLSPQELANIARNEDQISSGAFGDPTTQSVVFDGRTAIGLTTNAAIDASQFKIGLPPVPVNLCHTTVSSSWAAWGKSLFITDPAVIEDQARTWNPCTGAGTQGGHWTFAHFINEMAIGSLTTPADFATQWLSQWLNNYVVNGDIVQARPDMFNQVIKPWATASGVTATMTVDPFTGRNVLNLSGPLNLNIAPFSLRAIVNRIDLGKTSSGGGMYGSASGIPTTPGELRFIFGVVQPNPWGAGTEATCGRKPFTVIFEYGVPGTTCPEVVSWAQQWTGLQAMPGFTPAYLTQLDAMTESVVKHGVAPGKGNQNAINQIRTNEAALAGGGCGGWVGGPWELREFTLTNENPAANTDVAASGLLRKHTVAQTPDDATYSAGGPDPTINSFAATQVVPATASLTSCSTVPNYTVPYAYPAAGSPFRGGNSLIAPPFWRATINPPTGHNICARHQFSLNTCNGCHFGETATTGGVGNTAFTHINPLSPTPVPLSKFLTGGGPGLTWNVADPQNGSPIWQYADLQRRLQRLFDLSHCTSCAGIFTQRPQMIDQMVAMGPVPADIAPGDPRPFQVGSITNLSVVSQLLQLRTQFAGTAQSTQVDFLRSPGAVSH